MVAQKQDDQPQRLSPLDPRYQRPHLSEAVPGIADPEIARDFARIDGDPIKIMRAAYRAAYPENDTLEQRAHFALVSSVAFQVLSQLNGGTSENYRTGRAKTLKTLTDPPVPTTLFDHDSAGALYLSPGQLGKNVYVYCLDEICRGFWTRARLTGELPPALVLERYVLPLCMEYETICRAEATTSEAPIDASPKDIISSGSSERERKFLESLGEMLPCFLGAASLLFLTEELAVRLRWQDGQTATGQPSSIIGEDGTRFLRNFANHCVTALEGLLIECQKESFIYRDSQSHLYALHNDGYGFGDPFLQACQLEDEWFGLLDKGDEPELPKRFQAVKEEFGRFSDFQPYLSVENSNSPYAAVACKEVDFRFLDELRKAPSLEKLYLAIRRGTYTRSPVNWLTAAVALAERGIPGAEQIASERFETLEREAEPNYRPIDENLRIIPRTRTCLKIDSSPDLDNTLGEIHRLLLRYLARDFPIRAASYPWMSEETVDSATTVGDIYCEVTKDIFPFLTESQFESITTQLARVEISDAKVSASSKHFRVHGWDKHAKLRSFERAIWLERIRRSQLLPEPELRQCTPDKFYDLALDTHSEMKTISDKLRPKEYWQLNGKEHAELARLKGLKARWDQIEMANALQGWERS